MFHRIYALICKELLMVFKDPKVLVVLIVPPMIQLLIFAWAMTLDVTYAQVGVWNRDNGARSIQLINLLKDSSLFHGFVRLDSQEEVERYLDNEKGLMVISFGEDFSRKIDAQKRVSFQLLLDGRHSNTAQILAGYVSSILDSYNEWLSKAILHPSQPTVVLGIHWFNPNLIYLWYTLPSLVATITMLLGLSITSLSIARERELGTFDQLLVMPLRPFEILVGKSLPAILIALTEGTIMACIAIFVFKIPFQGSFPLLLASLLVFVSCIVGVGLFLSSIVKTQQQAILSSSFFMTPSILLSGFATPIENMPYAFQLVTLFNPLRYMLILTKGIFLKNLPPHLVWHNIWPMILIAFATLTLAGWSFRRRLE